MDLVYEGVGLVIEQQCPWCSNTRLLIEYLKGAVKRTCTMNGHAPERKLPHCMYEAVIPIPLLTYQEKKRYGVLRKSKKVI